MPAPHKLSKKAKLARRLAAAGSSGGAALRAGAGVGVAGPGGTAVGAAAGGRYVSKGMWASPGRTWGGTTG